jgi:hypothetical protein
MRPAFFLGRVWGLCALVGCPTRPRQPSSGSKLYAITHSARPPAVLSHRRAAQRSASLARIANDRVALSARRATPALARALPRPPRWCTSDDAREAPRHRHPGQRGSAGGAAGHAEGAVTPHARRTGCFTLGPSRQPTLPARPAPPPHPTPAGRPRARQQDLRQAARVGGRAAGVRQPAAAPGRVPQGGGAEAAAGAAAAAGQQPVRLGRILPGLRGEPAAASSGRGLVAAPWRA